MTAVADPKWQAVDGNNKPVHNATLTIVHAEDGRKAETFLDPALTRRGANPRYSNLAGWYCNSSADGTAYPICLHPGSYIAIEEFPPSGKRASGGGSRTAFTVEPKSGVIQIIGAAPEPAKHTQTIVLHGGARDADRHVDTHVMGANGEAVETETAVYGGTAKPAPTQKIAAPTSNISAAIDDQLASIRARRPR